MISQIFFAILILALVLFIKFYISILKTKRLMIKYKESFQKAGYKVKLYPFQSFVVTWLIQIMQCSLKLDNGYKFFEQLKGYDVAIGCSFNKPSIAIVNPEIMKQYYEAPVGDYVKYLETLRNMQRLFGSGMIYSQGDISKRKRKIISQVFHYEFVKSLIPNTLQCFNNIFDAIDRQNLNSIDAGELFKDLFCNLTINSFFGHQGYKCEINGKKFSKFFVSLVEDVSIRNYTPIGLLFPKILKLGIFQIDRSINERVRLFNNFAHDYIQTTVQKFKKMTPEQINQVKQKDIFAAMYFLGNINKQEKNEDHFNYDEFLQEFALFVTAGTQTSAVHTTNMIYHLAKNPQVKKKLLRQIDQHIKSESDLNAQTLKKMKYLDGISQESFRMTPPAPILFMRIAAKQSKLGQVIVQEGTSLIHDTTPTKGMEERYFPNPQKFNPERWYNMNLQNAYTFLPFSAGIRNCIGQHMALILSKIMLISFINRYEFQVNEKARYHLKFIMTPLPFKTEIKKKVKKII